MLRYAPLLLLLAGCGQPAVPRVVVYCAQDQEFAESLLADFTKATGVRVDAKYDTEATKSVSLTRELLLERDRPRCDVHWNNEPLGTLKLAKAGLYDIYRSPAAAPYPQSCKAPDGTWHAFAGRARVLIVNTQKLPLDQAPRSLLDLTDPKLAGQVAMAKPQFGTTFTQAVCLFDVLGPDQAKAFYRALAANRVQLVSGNKQVAEAVGRGEASVGTTDTDDAIAEVEAGRPVAIVFPDRNGHPQHPRMGTLFLPNVLAVVKGGPHPDAARKLIDTLLGEATERRLAEGPAKQMPLNPAVTATLPPALAAGRDAKPMAVDFATAVEHWDNAMRFVTDTFAR